MGNGRATVLRFAQEGARVMVIDRDLKAAEETVSMAKQWNDDCIVFEADVTRETTLAAAIAAAHKRWGRIDILHYNVGISLGGGDTTLLDFTEEVFDRIGAIIMISSLAAWEKYPTVAYKAIKAGLITFTQQVAIQNAEYGIRANVILPGKINTPMSIEPRVRATGKSHAEVIAELDTRVPLRHKQGTAWDIANAALFLASEEVNFITGVVLPVDGGGAIDMG
jgi:NAD(P)-dependent dehydrogenase (short-subunit alcohol dehydrogenase family)